MKTKIGIIGLGHFGKVLATACEKWENAEVLTSSRSGGNASFEDVCGCDFIFPCVPIAALGSVLQKMSGDLGENSVVVDVCSVKTYAVCQVKKFLPEVSFIASHPMFGPESTKNGTDFAGLNWMMENISAEEKKYVEFRDFAKKLGTNVVEISCDEHDKYAAYSINYNHFMGRVGAEMGLQPTPIDTMGFKIIYRALDYVTKDSFELFCDMQNFNPYSREMRKKFAEAVVAVEEKLKRCENVPDCDCGIEGVS